MAWKDYVKRGKLSNTVPPAPTGREPTGPPTSHSCGAGGGFFEVQGNSAGLLWVLAAKQ